MAKFTSKIDYMKKLKFYLSFWFHEDENAGILNDYEEWFENERLLGKSEEQICAALNNPKEAVKKILAESGESTSWTIRLIQNIGVQMLILMAVYLFTGLFILKSCNKTGSDYFYAAVVQIFLYFVVGMIRIKKYSGSNRGLSKLNVCLHMFVFMILLFELVLLPKITVPNSGKICGIVCGILLVLLVLLHIYMIMKNCMQIQRDVFLTTFYIAGIMMLLLFWDNQLHMLYGQPAEYRKLVYGSICLYVENLVLCAVFFKSKCGRKE